MSEQDTIDRLNARRPDCLVSLGASVKEMNREEKSVVMAFTIPLDFCHSGNVIQGGFVAAMLDAAMSHAVFTSIDDVAALPTLELKVSYLSVSLAGSFTANGRIIKAGKSIVFLEGQLFDDRGELTATASSTAKLIFQK